MNRNDLTSNLTLSRSEWRAANRKKIEERQAKSKAELQKVLAQAEADRNQYYEQRQKQLDVVKKANR